MASPRIIGALDLGSAKTTAVIAVAAPDEPPKVIGTATVPSKGVKKGIIINIEDAVNSIAQALTAAERMADESIGEIFISVSGKSILSKNNKGVIAITSEEITHEDVIRAIEAARTIMIPQDYEFLHVIPREYTVDSQPGIKYPIGMSGARLEVECHFILAPSSLLRNLAKCVQKLGLNVQAAIYSGWADTYSVLTDTEKELGVTLVDIGAGTTDVVIYNEGGVVFSKTIPLGGANITGDIAAGFHLGSLEDAEKIKLHYREIMEKAARNAPEKEEEKSTKKQNKESQETRDTSVDISELNIPDLKKISANFLDEIIRIRVEEILDLIKKEANNAGFDIATPAGIVVTGGTAKLYNITKMIKNYLNVPARIGLPKGLTGMVDELNSPEYATIYGMVLYAAENPDATTSVSHGSESESIIGKIKSLIKSIMP